MRLYNVYTHDFAQYYGTLPSYVIASHRWTAGSETTFQDVQKKRNTDRYGYKKLQGFADYVKTNLPGIHWIWVDTCCINQRDNAELSEAVNRMFDWYRGAVACFAYLEDVHRAHDLQQFERSEWFKRGWTLQELLAPRTVIFLARDWKLIGHKGCSKLGQDESSLRIGEPLEPIIASITGVPEAVLLDSGRLDDFAVDEKLKWVEGRNTTREEDMSYCLFGLLDVAIGAKYGEGKEKARRRLLKEIKAERSPSKGTSSLLVINTDFAQGQTRNLFLNGEKLPYAPSDTQSEQSLSEQEQSCLEKLIPEHLYGRQSSIGDRTQGTLGWLASDGTYTSWRASPSAQTLLITGYGGCGKSVMSSYIARSLANDSTCDAFVCQYFLDGTIGGQSDPCKLLRSLVYQIAVNRRKLAKIVRKRMMHYPQILNDAWNLWTLFEELATHDRARNLHVVIDAIDECETTGQESLVRHLLRLTSPSARMPVKVLLTSRPHSPAVSVIENQRSPSLRLALEDKSDIIKVDVTMFIQEQVAKFVRDGRCLERTRSALEEALERKAEATFLWIPIALSIIHRRRLWKPSELIAELEILPPQLSEMYDRLLSAIPEEDQELANRTLQVVLTSTRNLTVDEQNAMVTINSTHQTLDELRSDPHFTDIRSVERLLEGLVKVSNNRIFLIHHSLKEFLINRSPGKRTNHFLLAEKCMRFLLLDDLKYEVFINQSPNSNKSPDLARTHKELDMESDTDSLMGDLFLEPMEATAHAASLSAGRLELFDYAARFWHFHFAQCQLDEHVLRRSALRLYDPDKQDSWYRYLLSTHSHGEEYPSDPDKLTLACFFGHYSILPDIVSHEACHSCSSGAYWAARNGHTDCVKYIFSSFTDLSSWSPHTRSSPLHTAVAYGHLDIVRFLLSKHFTPVNQAGPGGGTLLSLAAAGAFCGVIYEILKEEDADANIPDATGATTIFWAVSAGSLEAVRILLADRRTNINITDHKGRSALSWACEYGQVNIVQILTMHSRSKISERDDFGRTPLIYAVLSGSLDLVKFLLRHGMSNVSQQDLNGRGAISWAAQKASKPILEALLRKNAQCANVQDVDGWTPLAWTFDPPERLANARTLIPYVAHELNHQAGLKLFSLAISWKAFAIAELLLASRMFHVNTASPSGRTALSYAAEVGHLNLVRQLLVTTNIDVTLHDDEGCSPYSYAAAAGHSEICKLISGATVLSRRENK